MTLIELIQSGASQLRDAQVAFGHGTTNAFDEAAWLVLWCLGEPLSRSVDPVSEDPDSIAEQSVLAAAVARVQALFDERIRTRVPAAYLTHEAWLQGVPFYVDARCIVPRSLIAELLVEGGIDYWLTPSTRRVLDLCTGNGSLAVLAAMVYPDTEVTGSDLSPDALAVAQINLQKHALQERVSLLVSDGLKAPELLARGPFDLILCNPPYVNALSMAALPAEYRAEPALALAGGSDGMDFVRTLLASALPHLSEIGVLVLEIGHERAHFEVAFPRLDAVWLATSAGEDQVLLVTRETLLAQSGASVHDGRASNQASK
ncbi:MAG: 50S ribosomal protein L3 N(5)-glutamine methyltransferase [Rhodoferax sp.]|nr:50S ribosomal protein L3 N(5)-glutamine methyltransferase [Rhodoferax sp.]MCF8208330.1 50S ribosomal protein L3 N(5)-glutamine methyltransferase [Rhodoferax sp.]